MRCTVTPAPKPRSYKDVLARSTRLRPDGSPVWPLTDADRSGMYGSAGRG